METTIEFSAFDVIEKGIGLIACTAGCIYGGTLLYPEVPLKVFEQISFRAALGLGTIALAPRAYSWIDSNIQDVFGEAVSRVQQFIEDHPLFTFATTASLCAVGCSLTNPITAIKVISLAKFVLPRLL